MLEEVSLNKISQEVQNESSQQSQYGYYSKPRRAKENRYFKGDDFSVEIFAKSKV